MRSLPAELAAEIIKEYFALAHLFSFNFTTPKKWTDYEQDIYFGGSWYTARGIEFPVFELSLSPKIDSIDIKIDDVDRILENIILNEDIRDKSIDIFTIALDKNIQVLGTADRLFKGYCDFAKKPKGSNSVEIKVYNHMGKYWRRITPRRTCSPTCPWDFKKGPDIILGTDSNNYRCKLNHVAFTASKPITGASWGTYWELGGSGPVTWTEGDTYMIGTCRYSGEEIWCDRSYTRCGVLGNQLHFGGFRWITYLQDKQLYWGRTPKAD